MEATELVLQGAMANQTHKQKPLLFCQTWEIWNNTHQECARPRQIQMGMSDKTPGICRHPKCKGSVPNQSSIPICVYWKAFGLTLKTRFKGASPNQKLLNLWIRIQANNQEQGAMPNVNIPTLQAAYVLGGQYQI